jgi:hypothetical protein
VGIGQRPHGRRRGLHAGGFADGTDHVGAP